VEKQKQHESSRHLYVLLQQKIHFINGGSKSTGREGRGKMNLSTWIRRAIEDLIASSQKKRSGQGRHQGKNVCGARTLKTGPRSASSTHEKLKEQQGEKTLKCFGGRRTTFRPVVDPVQAVEKVIRLRREKEAKRGRKSGRPTYDKNFIYVRIRERRTGRIVENR